MEELIESYDRKIKSVNELLEKQNEIVTIKRLETKRGCYRAFIVDLKRALAETTTSDSGLNTPCVNGSASAKISFGITPDKKYAVTYKGKDETEVVNDFGHKECYSDDYFENCP